MEKQSAFDFSAWNLAEKPSLSLHIYGSNQPVFTPNDSTRIYEAEKKRVRITSGAAYLNGTESLSEPETNIKTNETTLLDYLAIVLPYYARSQESEMVSYIRSVIQNPSIYFRGPGIVADQETV